MTQQSSSQSEARRKHLKNLVFGGSAVAAAQMLPDKWTKPVLSTAIMPAMRVSSRWPTPLAR